jgi:hypothetical protein
LKEYGGSSDLASLIEASHNASLAPIVRAVASLRVEDHQLGNLQIDSVVEHIDEYLDCIEDTLQASFVCQTAVRRQNI